MDLIEITGFAAALFTTISFLPQAVLIIRTGNTEGISVTMYSMFTFGVCLWLIYGISLNYMPIIAANIITLALASIILGLTVRNKLRARRDPQLTKHLGG